MRRLLSLTILIAVILGGLWLGGETLLARKLRQVAAADPALAIGSVSELRELRRIGVRLDDLNVTRPAASLTGRKKRKARASARRKRRSRASSNRRGSPRSISAKSATTRRGNIMSLSSSRRGATRRR